MTSTSVFARFKRHWLSGLLFLIPLTLYLVGALALHLPDPYLHVMLTLTAVLGIHVLDRLFLVKDVEESLDELIQDVRKDISTQTTSLVRASKSLEAMDRSGVIQMYPSRTEAAEDIRADIEGSDNSKIRLMGISLNDFVQGINPTLMVAWNTLRNYVNGDQHIRDQARGLDIRILIIDPLCFGAMLRSEAESGSIEALALRLETDVEAAARALSSLAKTAKSKSSTTGVTFDCRLYRLPPISFLCWVDSVCYVQPYHFWSLRHNSTPTPVLRFRRLAKGAGVYPYHAEIEHHFDWIWKNASISVDEYLNGAAVGTDKAVHQCGVANIYTDPKIASDRIVYLLKRAEKRVTIQGISLSSFFKPGELREAISGVLEKEVAQLEVLILDPECEQAKYRSYRERLFVSPDQGFEDYLAKGDHEKSDLYFDTNRTIQNLQYMIEDIYRRKGNDWAPKLIVGLYSSAPSCFVLRIDDGVLAEQYHYGKLVRPDAHAILGKDMPLVEYRKEPSPLYQMEGNKLPFNLLVDHLEYAVARSRKLPIGLRVGQDAS